MKSNLKQKYLVFLIMICFIAMGLYYSYALFVSKQLQENVTYLKTGQSLVSLKVLNDEKLIIPKESVKEYTLLLQNDMEKGVYYEVFFKKNDTFLYVTSTASKGFLEGKEQKNVSVKVTNKNAFDVEISFFLETSDEENILKEVGYSYINSEDNFDHSMANYPVLTKTNFIPVAYMANGNEEGYWYKADVKNQDNLWYDYDSGIWANAVMVKDEKVVKYQKASLGEVIEIEDIIGYFVWIPRFKYVLLNANNYTNYEQNYNVLFEKGKDQTGTVSCVDKISSFEDSHLYSEVCSDNKYHKIYDNLSTYTHPAFQDKEGFWVAKFLISESMGYEIVPNAPMLKKDMKDALVISENILEGRSHLLTNMEYASMTILTNSQYGKSNNQNYFNLNNYSFKRVYANNNLYYLTGCSTDYDNYSKSFITTETKKCVNYNDFTNYTHVSNSVNYLIGNVGPGASSTGTIYGVYDMANLSGELVAAQTATKDGSFSINKGYYDKYSYSDYVGNIASSKSIANLYRYKLGDGIKENIRTISSYGMWQGGSLTQQEKVGVMLRGGSGEAKSSSIYTAVIVKEDYVAPFRVSIF